MKKSTLKNTAASTLEYVLLITIILGAILVTQKYIVRGFAGRWKQVGDTFGLGRQYDPRVTKECVWSGEPQNLWYNPDCLEQQINLYYQGNYDDCYLRCIFRGDFGSCGGTSDCGLWQTECCDSRCQEECTAAFFSNCTEVTINGVAINCAL